jgi:uncharacterized protein (UPF0333 family)
MFRVKSKGQSTLEYVILLGFVVAALISMGIYMKRGFQGRLRESTDQVGGQYSAKKTSGVYTITSQSGQKEKLSANGASETTIIAGENWQSKTGSETINTLVSDEN